MDTSQTCKRFTGGAWDGESEYVVGSLDDALALFEALSRTSQTRTPFGFIWRGHEDADWPLHSTLYRDLTGHKAGTPDELTLVQAESNRVKCAHGSGCWTAMRAGP